MSLWWRFRSGGRLWSVYRGSPDRYHVLATDFDNVVARHLYDEDQATAAITIASQASIYVNTDAHDATADEDETVLHEMMHAAVDAVPADRRDFNGADEERFIRAVSPKLWPLLKARGLRWPPRRGGR